MTTTSETAPAKENKPLKRAQRSGHYTRPGESFWSKTWVRVTVVVIAAIWSLPTVGLLISSFRSADAIAKTGWWTVFRAAPDAGKGIRDYHRPEQTGPSCVHIERNRPAHR